MTPMQGLLNRDGLTVEAIGVRPALIADRAAIYRLTENSHRVHFNLDWWTFDNWLYEERPSDAIWLAHFHDELIGVLVAPCDESPVIWLRSIALANSYSADPVFLALLKHARSAWLALGVERAVVLAHPEWVSALTQRLNFERYNEIVTLRKSDRGLPELSRRAQAVVRPAVFADIPAIAYNDRAAFDTVWWHSEASLNHILKTVSHFVVAVIDDRVVGHAFSDLYGGQGHLIRLVVHPAYQRLGIGEQLLAESLRYQIELSAYPLTLNTQVDNLASQALYRRYGFQAAGHPVQVMQHWLS
jgi:[ribosomal protein S18]-alanine N-acetyltransferase